MSTGGALTVGFQRRQGPTERPYDIDMANGKTKTYKLYSVLLVLYFVHFLLQNTSPLLLININTESASQGAKNYEIHEELF